jgi:hypothetical protein
MTVAQSLDRFVVLVDELAVARRMLRKNFGDRITHRNGLDVRQQEALCRISLFESTASGWAYISRLNAHSALRREIKNFNPADALRPPLSAGD